MSSQKFDGDGTAINPNAHSTNDLENQTETDRCATLNESASASASISTVNKNVLNTATTATTTRNDMDVDLDNNSNNATVSRFTRLRSSHNFLTFTVGLAIFVDMVCYGIIMPLTPFIVERLGLKSTANGALIACFAVGVLISSPIAGIISDKMANRRTPMIVGLVGLLLATILFMEGMDHFWLLLISRFCAGVAGGTMMTLGLALLSDTFPSNQLGQEMGKVMIGQSLGLMVGPPVGGLLQDNVGDKAPYVFCIVLIVIDLVCRLLIIEPRTAKVKAIREFQKQQKQQQQQQQQQQPATGIVGSLESSPSTPASAPTAAKETTILALLSNSRLLTSLAIGFTQAFLIAALEPVLPLFLADKFGLSKTKIGIIFLAFSLPSFISPVAGWFSDKHGAKIMSSVAIAICVVLVAVLGIPGMPLWAMIIFLVGIGGMCAIFLTPIMAEVSAVVRVTGDGDGFARAFSILNMCFSLGMVVGPLLGALIYQETSMFWTCILIAAVTLLLLPFVVLYMGGKAQKLRDQEQYERDMQAEDMVLNKIHNQGTLQEIQLEQKL